MKSKIIAAALVLFALGSAGCVSVVKLESMNGERRIASDDIVNVKLTPATATRQEGYNGKTTGQMYTIGPIWRGVFIGIDDAPATLEIASSRFEPSLVAMGASMRWTYTASCVLTLNGKAYPFTSVGSRAAALNSGSAMRQAVELSAVDASRQVRGIMAAVKETSK